MASGDSPFGYVVPKSMFSIAANASRLVATIVAEDLHSDDAVAGQLAALSQSHPCCYGLDDEFGLPAHGNARRPWVHSTSSLWTFSAGQLRGSEEEKGTWHAF